MGRRSGGITGITSITIHSGLLSELLNASTTSKRLMMRSLFCLELVFNFLLNDLTSLSKSSSCKSFLTASAPVNAVKRLPYSSDKAEKSCSVKICFLDSGAVPGSVTI